MNPDVIVLAAGKGTRMYSDSPKVLHPLAGRPMLAHVIETARSLDPRSIQLVVGYQADEIRAAFDGQPDLNWVEQREQLGTGHAVDQAMPELDDEGLTLVLYGDVPLVTSSTMKQLLATLESAPLAVLTLETDDPTGLGRIVRDAQGSVTAIVEEKDASEEQKRIREINTGIVAVRTAMLRRWLASLDNDNAQGEYYLTDIVARAHAENEAVAALQTPDPEEVQGVNNRLQLSQLERAIQRRKAQDLALSGVTVSDVARLDVRGTFECGRDVSLDVNVIIEGSVTIGSRCTIGPNVVLKDCEIDDDVAVEAHCHIEGARIGAGCRVGPFARLRPGTIMEQKAKIGNFVETKNAVIGPASKINHLSYVGDTRMAADVNVGAGTITCNYDGANKHQTIMEEGVFVGSNTALVAPVRLGKGATIAAGSVVTDEVEPGNLAVARGRQRNIAEWKRPEKQAKDND